MGEIIALSIPIVFILAGASVLILRPITKRLGECVASAKRGDKHQTGEGGDGPAHLKPPGEGAGQ